MNKKLKTLCIILIASYFIYRFYFNFISTSVQQAIFFGLLAAYGGYNYHRIIHYFNNLGNLKVLFIIIILLHVSVLTATFFVPIIYGTYDFTYFISNLRSFSYTVSYIILIDLIKVHLQPENLTEKFMEIFIYSSSLYVVFSILTLVLPPFRSFWLSIIHESERNLHLLRNNPSYIARFGWTGFSSFVVTFFVSIAILFSLFLLIKELKNTQRINFKYLMTVFLLLIGNSFYGRVGLFNSLALLILAIFYIILKSTKKHYAVFLVGGGGVAFLLFSVIQNFVPQMQQWYNWIMDPIINLLTTGQLNTTSTDHLFSMYFLPNFRTLLFGDGFYAGTMGNSYYMSVDVGYLRPMLFYGVIFLMIGYSICVLLALALSKGNKINIFLSLMLILTLFIFEVKGEVTLTLTPVLYALFLAEAETRKSKIVRLNYGWQSNNSLLTYPSNKEVNFEAEV